MSSRGALESVGTIEGTLSSQSRAELLTRLRRTLDAVAQGATGELIEPPAHGSGEWVVVGRYTRLGELAKGTLDRVLAAVGLLVISPLLLCVAIAVKLDSPGPAFFRQRRIGRGGRPFTFYKFRGMFVDAKERFPHLYEYRYSNEEVQTLRFHPDQDPRVTTLGRFLRHTSLDELPNLINVVLGDMSLVGPRPEIPELIPYYGRHAKLILSVKPGITSLAKCVGRDDLTFQETLDLDLRYIHEREWRVDLGILLGTVWKIAIGRLAGK